MRIRKRWPLLPPVPPTPLASGDLTPSRFPSLSSSELHPLSALSVEPNKSFHPPCNSPNQSLKEPKEGNHQIQTRSDLQKLEKEEKGDDSMQLSLTQTDQDPQIRFLVGEEEEVGVEDKTLVTTITSRNGNSSGAKACVGISVSSSSSSHQVGERWWEEERVFPLKKRKGSLVEELIMEKEKKTRLLRTKPNKWVQKQETIEEDNVMKKKKRVSSVSGGAIMGGSRCSRVNGRGWRCCQQTLVGYSLCEHHLGKGRLRSMNSVRSHSSSSPSTRTKKDEESGFLSSSPFPLENEEEEEEEEEEEKPLLIRKKRKKIGMVKARSISSLLDQTQHAPVVTLPTPPLPSDNNSKNRNLMI